MEKHPAPFLFEAVRFSLSPVLDASVKAYCVAQPMSGTAFGVAVPEAAMGSLKAKRLRVRFAFWSYQKLWNMGYKTWFCEACAIQKK